MGLVLSGTTSNVTTPLTATVTAIASGTGGVWRVQTSAPHLFGSPQGGGTGDLVQLAVTIASVPVVAFGFITVIDATHFDVAGTTYTATGTGTATDLSITPQFLVPTDADSFSLQISGMLSALQCLADRTQYLQHKQPSSVSAFLPSPDPWNENYPGGSGFQDTGIHLDLGPSATPPITPCAVGDVITAWFSGSANVTGSGQIRIATRDDYLNANVLAASITQTFTSSGLYPFAFMARHVVTNPGTSRVVVQLNESGGGNTIEIQGVGSMLVRRDRAF
jgi:hypothetical protein